MMTEIEGAEELYPFTASLLSMEPNVKVLDLGCGTGLELESFFSLNNKASVVGIDLSKDTLEAFKGKFPNCKIQLICASYFNTPFRTNTFDAAVSVESLHHFTADQKLRLYWKLKASLTDKGYFVLRIISPNRKRRKFSSFLNWRG